MIFTLNVYDFEIFRYDWMVTIINPVSHTDETIVNDRERLIKYYEAHKSEIWIGFNSRNYDSYILKAILCDFDPFEVSDFIIGQKRKGWQFSRLFRNFPLYDFDIMSGYNGLKTLEAFMGNNIKETSVDFTVDRELTAEEIEETKKYNRHDVEQTIEVFMRRKVEFDAHLALIKIFGLHISNISKSQAQLAGIILKANRVNTNDEWAIRLPDTLRLEKPEYKAIAEWFLKDENHDEKCALNVDIAGVPHTIAWGGIHGALKKYNYSCADDEILIMADVSQLYPCLMYQYHIMGRGVPDEGYKTLRETIDTSIRLKNEGKKKEREPYKRFNNIIYGAMGDKSNPMYDPLHRALVCVFGQVLLIDLIEKLEPFAKLIQSNTDGILVKIKKKDFERLDDAVWEWERRTGLRMTFDEYTKVYQGDVNNYVVVDAKGGFKTKGAYVKKLDDLDNDLPIVNSAILRRLTEGIPVEKTIGDCDDLIKYQKIVKISGKYSCGWHNGCDLTDKTFRVFASTSDRDTFIGKKKTANAKAEKFANTPEHCFIRNDDINGATVPTNLDRGWYIDLAKKRLKEKFDIE